MKLKTEEEILSEYYKLRKCIDDPTAIYLIYQMGFLEGAAPITGVKPKQEECSMKSECDLLIIGACSESYRVSGNCPKNY